VSGDTPDIVLNEFGDLSRKARRELEARGIDPDTAVVEYIAATGQMPVITPEAAAAAKAEAQVEAAVARDANHDSVAPVEQPAVEVVAPQPEVAKPTIPPVSVPVTAAETGPIEPLAVAPALDSGSLSAVEETLAAVSDQTGEIVTSGFDSLVASEPSEVPSGPTKGEARRLARKEKKANALALKEEKAAAAALLQAEAQSNAEAERAEQEAQSQRDALEAESAARAAEELKAQLAREAEIAAARALEEKAAAEAAARVAEQAQVDAEVTAVSGVVVEDTVIGELDPIDDDEYDEVELEPQTISEATAAIAIAEAVAAAEAVVEAGEVNIEYGNLGNAAPATTGSISVISNALILPTLPETTGSIAPINPTGEIVITGSILIPSSVSQVGANLENLDTSDIDVIKDDEEVAPTQGMAPVSAATAVSAYNISNSVVTTPRGMNERLPFILSITAAGLAVGVVALFVAGYFLGLF
jgi:hypothetical protein